MSIFELPKRSPLPPFNWIDVMDRDLTALYADYSKNTHQIAAELSEKYCHKFTKNAIIGRAKRLGLSRRPATWSDEITEDLKVCWTVEKMTALEISAHFTQKYNGPYSRNAIIGKVCRLGIGRPCHRYRPPTRKKHLKLVWSAPTERPLIGHEVSFKDLANNHCRFVIGDANGLETMFCGSPKQQGSYCGFHYQLTHGNDAAPRPQHRVGADAGSSTPERVNGVGSTLPGAA